MSRATLYVTVSFVIVHTTLQEDLFKCCTNGFHLRNTSCVPDLANHNFSNVPVHSVEGSRIFKNDESFYDAFHLVYNSSIIAGKLLENAQLLYTGDVIDGYDFAEKNEFCIEQLEISEHDVKPRFFLITNTNTTDYEESTQDVNYFPIISLLISCLFFLLIIVVYILVPRLRNFNGKITISCIVSLLGSFLTLAIKHITVIVTSTSLSSLYCYTSTSLFYFFWLSSFFWMNAHAFKMWRDNRHIFEQAAKNNYNRIVQNRKKENKAFLKYSLYAWGTPLLMTVFLVIVDNVDLEHRAAWFIRPNILRYGCFLSGNEMLLYLDLPMIILIASNWTFFIMTAYNLWINITETRVVIEDAKTLKLRLLVVLKLSIVMGISWLLEIVSHVTPGENLKNFLFIFDLYNGFMGVAFFVVLVCKKRIWLDITQKRKFSAVNTNSEYRINGNSMRMRISSNRSDNY
ncbi:unnamed protein product [Leptosia nina]|uniref:G-protein coupled receptors family 2 profile 2 domain-containing protein n=1 Tax=Leptosia nina TaxID=320188 RepID=A0AAV1JSB7_9NEOP